MYWIQKTFKEYSREYYNTNCKCWIFFDKQIYIDSFLHGHIKIAGHLQVTLKIAITGENILFFLNSLCILSEEASWQGFFAWFCFERGSCLPLQPKQAFNSQQSSKCCSLRSTPNKLRQSPWTSQVAESPSPTSTYEAQTKPMCTSFWLLKCATLSSIRSSLRSSDPMRFPYLLRCSYYLLSQLPNLN